MSRTPQPQHIYFVLTPKDGVRMYATKFLPMTNTAGCRLKWWWTNDGLEIVEQAETRQWSYKFNNQRDELQDALGSDYHVFSLHDVFTSLESLTTRMRVAQNDRDTAEYMNAQKPATL